PADRAGDLDRGRAADLLLPPAGDAGGPLVSVHQVPLDAEGRGAGQARAGGEEPGGRAAVLHGARPAADARGGEASEVPAGRAAAVRQRAAGAHVGGGAAAEPVRGEPVLPGVARGAAERSPGGDGAVAGEADAGGGGGLPGVDQV